MARPVVLTVAASVATSGVYVVDIHRKTGIALCVVPSGAGGTFSVEHTFDDPLAASFNPATATWIEHPTLKDVGGTGATTDSNYAYLPRGIRLKSKTGATTATLTIVQMGIAGD